MGYNTELKLCTGNFFGEFKIADTYYCQSKCCLFLVQTCFILHPLERVSYQYKEI